MKTLIALALLLSALACNDLSGLSGSQALPSGTPNPGSFDNPAGALALYERALYAFQYGVGDTATNVGAGISQNSNGAAVDYMLYSGLLTDELEDGNVTLPVNATTLVDVTNYTDARQLITGQGQATDAPYQELQSVRNDAIIGIGALAAYDSSAPPALRGQLYALQGYAIIYLADLFCSGVPLSSIDFNGDYSYHAGSTTTQLYKAAISEFDTALTLSSDSARIMNLARVGKGRAWLALGQTDSAAAAVNTVPDQFTYQFLVNWATGSSNLNIFKGIGVNDQGVFVSNLEGGTGLPYITSGDPRSAAQAYATNATTKLSEFIPTKYGGVKPGIFPFTVADWIEARLIRAEAALSAGDVSGWLGQLNTLRQTAITPALPLLSDPGTDSARVALLFQERAYWLFATGHRQGDMRRMLRIYNQYYPTSDAVYPTGEYPLYPNLSVYGGDVTAPIPTAEHANPLFTGCLSRGA